MSNLIGYVTCEEAKEFISLRYGTVEDEELKKALYLAFDKIESIGVRSPGTEKVFPRKNDKANILDLVKKAQILEAYSVMQGDGEDVSKMSLGVTSRSIGDMSISFDRSLKIGDVAFSNVEAARIMKRFSRKTF